MSSEQKIVLLVFLILFLLIPVYGLSHSLSTYNPTTRLSPGLVILLESVLTVLVYILFNTFSARPFHHLKKLLPWISTAVIVILLVLGFLFIMAKSYPPPDSPAVDNSQTDTTTIAPDELSIENGSGEALGKDRAGNDIFKLVVKNNSEFFAKDIMIKFEFMKSSDGPVEDTKYIYLSQSIAPGDTVTENVAVYTSFDTSGRYWWRAMLMGAKKPE